MNPAASQSCDSPSPLLSRDWDILIMGGGVIGLAIGLELRIQDDRLRVLVIEQQQVGAGASWAAAGMLAPQAENISDPRLAELCQRSLQLYPDWIERVEERGQLPAGYWNCGILKPLSYPAENGLTRPQLDHLQPHLGSQITSAIWLPQEGQVDNRLLLPALKSAFLQAGGSLLENVSIQECPHNSQQLLGIETALGMLRAQSYICCLGAWSGQMALPVLMTVFPRKGQMIALQDPRQLLQHILFGEDIYLVPRRDGRLLVGATVEEVGFLPGNTAGAVQDLLAAAIRLFPPLRELTVLESWWGFRPTTPDRLPILGSSPLSNLWLATGHDRNGILLAPITADWLAGLVLGKPVDPLLEAFSWRRRLATASS
ncbi:MAG: glycine oxidase ThiO [Cyanobacteriota bacterium]|nr:glycine oxidase ThiO [Cyanobacteriota bacterium]